MRRREFLLSSLLFLLTIFIITKMVPVHAEDSSDESTPYPTPTDVTDFIETPYPTMTEMAYDDTDPNAEPTQTDTPSEFDYTPTSVTEATPPPSTEVPEAVFTATPMPESLPSESILAEALLQTEAEATPLMTDRAGAGASPLNTLQCLHDTVPIITGTTNPSTMLEVRFELRVIGGGMSDPSGRYVIPLHMGIEASGRHPVDVVKRYSGRVIQQVFCDIP